MEEIIQIICLRSERGTAQEGDYYTTAYFAGYFQELHASGLVGAWCVGIVTTVVKKYYVRSPQRLVWIRSELVGILSLKYTLYKQPKLWDL